MYKRFYFQVWLFSVMWMVIATACGVQEETSGGSPIGRATASLATPSFAAGMLPWSGDKADPCGTRMNSYAQLWESPWKWDEVGGDLTHFELYLQMLACERHFPLWDFSAPGGLIERLEGWNLGVSLQTFGIPIQDCPSTLGEQSAEWDFSLIDEQWLSKGGAIDNIAVDHGYYKTIKHIEQYCPNKADKAAYATKQLGLYIKRMHELFEQQSFSVDFAVIDSLSLFEVSYDGVSYTKTAAPVPLPVCDLDSCYLSGVLAFKGAANVAELTVDFMHALDGDAATYSSNHEFDGKDWGRVLGAEAVADAHGLKCGVYFNAPNATDEATRKADTLRHVAGAQHMGVTPDVYRHVHWRETGNVVPEDIDTRTLNIIREGLKEAKTRRSHVALYRASDAQFRLYQTHYASAPSVDFSFGAANKVPLLGDWNANGIETIGIYNPDTSEFEVRTTNDSGPYVHKFQYGSATKVYQPIAGNFDGAGVEAVGLFEPAVAKFHLSSDLQGTTMATCTWGSSTSTYTPLAGDWDGDGVDGIGLFDHGQQKFFLNNQCDNMPEYACTASGSGLQPIAGDWDGDGSDGVGVYDPATREVRLWNAISSGACPTPDFEFTLPDAGAGPWVALAGATRVIPYLSP